MVYFPTVEKKFLSVLDDGFDDVEFAKYQKDRGLPSNSEHSVLFVLEDGLNDFEFAKYLGDCGLLRRSQSLPIALESRFSAFIGKVRSKCSLEQSTMLPSSEFSDDTNVVDYMETAYSLLHELSSEENVIRHIVTGGADDGWYPFSSLGHSAAPYVGTMLVSAPNIPIGSTIPSHAISTCRMSVPSLACGSPSLLASNMMSATKQSDVLDAGDRPIGPISERASPQASATRSSALAQREKSETAEEAAPKTTLMLCNTPVHYSRAMVMDLLRSEGFAEHVEFIYVPMNLRKLLNFGYAFVNLDSEPITLQCREKLQGFNGWSEPSDKQLGIEWSDSQGLEANIERYRNSPIMHESVPDELKPALFKCGVQVPFPKPTKSIRAPRLRKSGDQSRQNNESTNSVPTHI